MEKNGGIDSILLETQKSIIKEILELKIPLAKSKVNKLDEEHKNLNNVIDKMKGEINNLAAKIFDGKKYLKNSIYTANLKFYMIFSSKKFVNGLDKKPIKLIKSLK